ncbi:MAG: glycoside hydrolase family 3 N-terminal domain-containing protein, partial [Acidimicrobiales bacterium]
MTVPLIEELLGNLTLEEKISLLSGSDYWHTELVERLGIGRMLLSDGPSGVRGERAVGGASVSFLCGAALGATFDPEAARSLGEALADECHDKGAHVLLGPTVNLQRHPLGGRHFECYSEDPVLTAALAVSYIEGVQSLGVAATVKHFVSNDTEHERHTISSDVDEAVLREIYLLPFEAAVREARVWAVMSAYNKVNWTYAAENEWALKEVLRGEWGYDRLVVSDWFGTQSTVASVLAGLDLEMPGPPIHYGRRLVEAVEEGLVEERVVTERARQVLGLAGRTGVLTRSSEDGAPKPATAAKRTLSERRELGRRLAAASFVLLENRAPPAARGEAGAAPLLPLELRPGGLLAVIGPNAFSTAAQGGGSARVNPEHATSILEGLREYYEPQGVEVEHEIGCVTWSATPVLSLASEVEYFAGDDFGGKVLHREVVQDPALLWMGHPVPGNEDLRAGEYSVRLRGAYSPAVSGSFELSLAQVGTARLFVDGALLLESAASPQGKRYFGFGSKEVSTATRLEENRSYEIVVEYEVGPASPIAGVFLGARPPLPGDDVLIERAVALAKRADAVICAVGTSDEWETEGHDRSAMELPGRQDNLVRALCGANQRTA